MDNLAEVDRNWTASDPNYISSRFKRKTTEEATASALWGTPEPPARLKRLSRRPIFGIVIENKRYRVTKPIALHISREEDLYFADNDQLNISGYGASLREAISDAVQHIIYFHKYYKTLSAEQVTGDAVRLRQIFENLFEEE